MDDLGLLPEKEGFVGPTFGLHNRLLRLVWKAVWLVLARWTPAFAHRWRILLLRLFGARVSWRAYVYPDVVIWAPWQLAMADYATLGPAVICYNIAPVALGARAVVSQYAYLCTGTHDYLDPAFPLLAKSIAIGRRAWVCAGAFVGPGVTVGDGAVLDAKGVAHRDLPPWSVHAGNPAVRLRDRPEIGD